MAYALDGALVELTMALIHLVSMIEVIITDPGITLRTWSWPFTDDFAFNKGVKLPVNNRHWWSR